MRSLMVLITLFSASMASASDACVLKAGSMYETYSVNDSAVAVVKSNRALGYSSVLRTEVAPEKFKSQFEVVQQETPYHTKSVLTEKLELKIKNIEVRRGQGNSCDYRGVPSGDPDFKCDDTNEVFWARTVMYLTDSSGNEWTYFDDTPELKSAAQVASDEALTSSLKKDLAIECARY